MEFEDRYPEYVSVAELVRQAQAERSIFIAHLIAGLVERAVSGARGLMRAILDAERDWHELEAESFARHAAKRY